MRTTYLTLLAIGLAGFAVTANAQYYSPYSSGPYRAELIDDDDIDGPEIYPPPPGAAPRAPVVGSYDSQPLPPPGASYSPPAYSPPPAPQPPTYAQPQPPNYGQPQPPAYAQPQPPNYGQPQPPTYAQPQPTYAPAPAATPSAVTPPREAYIYDGDRYRPRSGVGQPYGFEPLRPPGDIGTARAAPGYSTPPGSVPAPSYAPTPGYAPPAPDNRPTGSIDNTREPAPGANRAYASLPADYRPEEGQPKQLSPHLRRQLVDFQTTEPTGTLIVDTPNTFLYLVLGNGKAMRYGIGVGREGFTWAGVERVRKMAEWPDWHPPKEMIERQPYLPRFMAGGESNPLGARALYLGNTVYRIHGTNQPSTIGTFVSSGCIRLTNDDITDLYQRVQVGTRVVVLPKSDTAKNGSAPAPASAELPTSSQVIR